MRPMIFITHIRIYSEEFNSVLLLAELCSRVSLRAVTSTVYGFELSAMHEVRELDVPNVGAAAAAAVASVNQTIIVAIDEMEMLHARKNTGHKQNKHTVGYGCDAIQRRAYTVGIAKLIAVALRALNVPYCGELEHDPPKNVATYFLHNRSLRSPSVCVARDGIFSTTRSARSDIRDSHARSAGVRLHIISRSRSRLSHATDASDKARHSPGVSQGSLCVFLQPEELRYNSCIKHIQSRTCMHVHTCIVSRHDQQFNVINEDEIQY
uniref:Uncharacterized protein n=1 Tax=Trichogramma kaykai TaxID=54128 RepID=A0ABD2XDR4_9HYME